MKTKLISIFVCTLLIISSLALLANAKKETAIKEKIEQIVFLEPKILEQNQYITLYLEEATSCLMEPGKPVLPVYIKTFKFPFGTKIKNVECQPLQVNQRIISGEIQPSPEPVLLNDINNEVEKKANENFVSKDNTVYSSLDFFPNRWYDYQIGNGLDSNSHVVFLTIRVYPVRYSPGQNMIQYVNTADIKVEYFEPLQPVVFKDDYDMVVITPLEYSESLQPLIDYKNDGIIATKLVTLDDIYSGTYFPVQGRDDQEKIKYFIKDSIENWGISYVILAGGVNNVPVRLSYCQDGKEESFISDLYYADIYNQNGDFCSWDSNGNDIFGEYEYQGRYDQVDLYPDVHLGRLNFWNTDEVSDVVNKIITYESTGAYTQEWFSNFLVCGGDTAPDYENIDEGEYLNQKAIDIMDGFNPIKIWASNGKLYDAINIDNAINYGVGFIYFSGHGDPQSWGTHPHNDFENWIPSPLLYRYTRVDNLNNKEMVPIVIIGGCSNCDFSDSVCFGWSFLKNPNGGGIAVYGNSALGWIYVGSYCDQGLTGAREQYIFKAYKYQNSQTVGEVWSQSINTYINNFGLFSALDLKTMEEWQPFIDPSVRIVKISDKPNKPDIPNGPVSGAVKTEYTYTTSTTDPNDDLIKYCFSWGDGTISWTDLLESGVVVSSNHMWDTPGYYEVKVKARDKYGLDSEWSEHTTMHIQGAIIDIQNITGGFLNVNAVIKNIGDIEIPDINWNISVKGGIIGFINVFTQGTIDTPLVVGGEEKVTCKKIFGIGKVDITVKASSPDSNLATKTKSGFALGPFIIVW